MQLQNEIMKSMGVTMEFSYNDLRDRIILKLKEATGKLREMEYESQHGNGIRKPARLTKGVF